MTPEEHRDYRLGRHDGLYAAAHWVARQLVGKPPEYISLRVQEVIDDLRRMAVAEKFKEPPKDSWGPRTFGGDKRK